MYVRLLLECSKAGWPDRPTPQLHTSKYVTTMPREVCAKKLYNSNMQFAVQAILTPSLAFHNNDDNKRASNKDRTKGQNILTVPQGKTRTPGKKQYNA